MEAVSNTMASKPHGPKTSSIGEYGMMLLENLHSLYLNEIFCDVYLVAGATKFHVHRSIFSAASPYFHAMFTGNLYESQKDEISMQNIGPHILEKLIRFIYTGKINVCVDDAQDLLSAADMLQLTHVVEICCNFLNLQLHSSNCIGIYHFADAISCVDLCRSAEAFIYSHFLEVVKSHEFVQMPLKSLIYFLQSENLLTDNEYQVFTSAMKWLFEDITSRRQNIYDVLMTIRLPLISQRLLNRYIESCADVSVKVVLRTLSKDLCRKRQTGNSTAFALPLLCQPRKYTRKTIYVIGGYSREEGGRWADCQTMNSVESFNSFTQQWKGISRMHVARSGHGATALNGLIYVVGGECDSMIYDSVECFDPIMNKWSWAPSMTLPRSGLGLCTVEDRMYAFGGWVGSDIGTTVESFDPLENRWTTVGQVKGSSHRFAMGVVEYQGLVFLVGGKSELGVELSSVDCFNPATNEWKSVCNMSTKRAYAGVTSFGGFIFAIGGSNENEGTLSTVERFSFEDNTWTYVSSMSVARCGAAVAVSNRRIYVFGGREYSSEFYAPATLASVESYEPETDSWTFVDCMAMSRCDAVAAVT